MSAVIKSGVRTENLHVRGLGEERPAPSASAEAQMIQALETRLLEVGAEIAALREEGDRLKAAAHESWREGHAKGLVEGRKEAEDRSDALARTLANAASDALDVFRERLSALEEATGDLTALALERIVGDPAGRQALVMDTARRAVADLFAGAVVAVEVSGADFADAGPLRAVLPADCEVQILEGLPSGACRLRLKMGEVELDLQGQAARLRALLDGGEAAR